MAYSSSAPPEEAEPDELMSELDQMKAEEPKPVAPAPEPDEEKEKRKKLLTLVVVFVVIVAVVAVALIAILSRPAAPPTTRLGALAVIPNQVSLNIGSTKVFVARATSTTGRVLQGNEVTVTWSLNRTGIGSLNRTTGLDTNFTAAAQGLVMIIAVGSAGGVTKTAMANVTVLPPPIWVDHFTVGAPGSVVVGDPITLVVTAIDNLGATCDAYLGTVHFTTTDTSGSVVLPADYTFTAGDAGVHTFTDGSRLFTPGAQIITVRDTTNASVMGSATIQVSANQPPTASFTVTKNGWTINVDASASSDPDGTIVSYNWTWGEPPAGTGVTTSHTYAADGVYTVNLTVADDRGAQAWAEQSVSLFQPTASFVYTKAAYTLNVDAGASSDPDGTIVGYQWNWGDGTPAGSGVTAAHTFAADGDYSVTLTVTDDGGLTGTQIQVIGFHSPVASFIFATNNLTVNVDASASTDSDGTIASYSWDWGDATPLGSGVTATHTYAAKGTYTVTLTVTDNDGLTGTLGQPVSAYARPIASFTFTTNVLTVDVDGSGSSDPDGFIVSWSWDWGDGTPLGSGVTASHTYATAGNYTITLTVTDDDALTDWTSRLAVVGAAPQPPNVLFSLTIDGLNFLLIADATASFDPDGMIVSYDWDWGDATPLGSGVIATHTYAAPGNYLVTLTLTDDDTLTNSSSRPVSWFPPVAVFMVTIDGLNFRLLADATLSSDTDGTIVSYEWDWGDATPLGSGVGATHTYAVPGLYTVTLNVTDNDGFWTRTSQPVSWFPPTASFTLVRNNLTVDVDGTGSSDPDGAIASWTWDWGDATPFGTGAAASHTYAVPGAYVVWLNVTDADGFWNRTSRPVGFAAPQASFTLVRDRFTINVDASASSDSDGTIVAYDWDWGDATPTGSGVTAMHTYAMRGYYTVTLTVTDNDGLQGTAQRGVTVNGTTLDYRYYDFFSVPYGEWWDYRTGVYGDLPIGADCFNQTSIADGVCVGTTWSTYPYTNWFPAPGNINPGNPNTNPMLQTMYRFNVTGVDVPAYTIDTPVILPRLGPALPGGSVTLDWDVGYMDLARATQLETDAPWNAVPDNCGSLVAGMDGFTLEATLTMTMDYDTSRKLFGVTGDPATWWSAQVNEGCLSYGTIETAYETWLVDQGGLQNSQGTYDIMNSYEWFYSPFFTDIVWQVTPGPGGTNTTTVTVHHGVWGFEILMARWFYYGRTTYVDSLTLGTPPAGWWGMELGWFDDFHMTGTISTDFDFTLDSAMAYHFMDVGMPGPDNILGTADDYSAWNWMPILSDYIEGGARHPDSELNAYAGLTYMHDSPGSRKYAVQWAYELVPHVWNLEAGETLTFLFPTTPVVFYDPVASPRDSNPATLVSFSGVLAYDRTRPAVFGRWDAVAETWSTWGPTAFPSPALPLYGDAMPGIWLRS